MAGGGVDFDYLRSRRERDELHVQPRIATFRQPIESFGVGKLYSAIREPVTFGR
jgi:hypothetical protein